MAVGLSGLAVPLSSISSSGLFSWVPLATMLGRGPAGVPLGQGTCQLQAPARDHRNLFPIHSWLPSPPPLPLEDLLFCEICESREIYSAFRPQQAEWGTEDKSYTRLRPWDQNRNPGAFDSLGQTPASTLMASDWHVQRHPSSHCHWPTGTAVSFSPPRACFLLCKVGKLHDPSRRSERMK